MSFTRIFPRAGQPPVPMDPTIERRYFREAA